MNTVFLHLCVPLEKMDFRDYLQTTRHLGLNPQIPWKAGQKLELQASRSTHTRAAVMSFLIEIFAPSHKLHIIFF